MSMAPHSSTLAWKIPWTEEPGGLQSMGLLRVGHDWATSLSLYTFMHWRRKWQPTPVFLPGEYQGWEAWWAAIYGVSQSRTRLKRLSSSSTSWQNGSLGPGTTYLEVVSKRWDWKGLEPIVKFKDSLNGIRWRACSDHSHGFILFPFQ